MAKIVNLFFILLFILSCLGCGNEQKPITKDYGYSVVDDRGKKLTFSQPPQRIATLHYATDEIVLDLVDNSRVAAVSRSGKNPEVCNNLEKAKKISKVVEPNVEFMLANNIDCLIIRENYDKNFIEQAEQAGIKVAVVKNPKDIAGVKQFVRKIAEILQAQEQGEKLVKELEANIVQVTKEIGRVEPEKQKRVMVISGYGASSMRGSIVDEIFKYAQLRNAAEKLELNLPKNSKVRLSKEQIIACNPDCLLIISVNKANKKAEQEAIEKFKQDEGLRSIKAMRTGQLIHIPMKYTVCFSHYIGKNILALSKAVYKGAEEAPPK